MDKLITIVFLLSLVSLSFAVSFDPEHQLSLVNAQRAANQLPPLRITKCLMDSSRFQSEYQASIKDMTHENPAGDVLRRCQMFGTNVKSTASENVAWNQQSDDQVVDDWMNSKGHRENILRPQSTSFGCAMVLDSYGNAYWTQNFADGTCTPIESDSSSTSTPSQIPSYAPRPTKSEIPEAPSTSSKPTSPPCPYATTTSSPSSQYPKQSTQEPMPVPTPSDDPESFSNDESLSEASEEPSSFETPQPTASHKIAFSYDCEGLGCEDLESSSLDPESLPIENPSTNDQSHPESSEKPSSNKIPSTNKPSNAKETPSTEDTHVESQGYSLKPVAFIMTFLLCAASFVF
eukprot:gene1155-1321_t